MGIVKRDRLRDVTGDPWGGRTLEWSTTSPPPAYNFAFTPAIYDLDAWHDMKTHGYRHPTEGFRPLHMPRNTGAGLIIAALSVTLGFGMVWYMWWLAAISFVGILAVAIGHSFNESREYFIPADTIALTEGERTQSPAARH
jgi:cytochrome o ubiquinol oxidase subunit 1